LHSVPEVLGAIAAAWSVLIAIAARTSNIRSLPLEKGAIP
jgi:alkanesulfonate monooxygenase SsuD/methylene tetrahydromethanopterin reductase-like flavin-dependent oxidoreductase (luciferase family)